jgi:hypothetical protein
MYRSFLTCLILASNCFVGTSSAQSTGGTENIMLFGIVEDQRSGRALQNVRVRVYTDSIAGDSVFTDPTGKYQIFLPLNGSHRLEYWLEDHHRKVVQVDANGEMDATARAQEWNLRVDIDLLIADPPLPDDLLDMPAGVAEWEPAMRDFQWNRPYSERYKQRYKQALKEAGRK